jgi:hypothetical protein
MGRYSPSLRSLTYRGFSRVRAGTYAAAPNLQHTECMIVSLTIHTGAATTRAMLDHMAAIDRRALQPTLRCVEHFDSLTPLPVITQALLERGMQFSSVYSGSAASATALRVCCGHVVCANLCALACRHQIFKLLWTTAILPITLHRNTTTVTTGIVMAITKRRHDWVTGCVPGRRHWSSQCPYCSALAMYRAFTPASTYHSYSYCGYGIVGYHADVARSAHIRGWREHTLAGCST